MEAFKQKDIGEEHLTEWSSSWSTFMEDTWGVWRDYGRVLA